MLLVLYGSGLGMARRYRALLADALEGGFGLLLALKIVLALSVAGHFIVAMSLRRRGRLVSSVSRRLHLSLAHGRHRAAGQAHVPPGLRPHSAGESTQA